MLSGDFRGRNSIANRRPLVRNVREDFFSTIVASNHVFGGRLGVKNVKKQTLVKNQVFLFKIIIVYRTNNDRWVIFGGEKLLEFGLIVFR